MDKMTTEWNDIQGHSEDLAFGVAGCLISLPSFSQGVSILSFV